MAADEIAVSGCGELKARLYNTFLYLFASGKVYIPTCPAPQLTTNNNQLATHNL
jgi:hypothetical protein